MHRHLRLPLLAAAIFCLAAIAPVSAQEEGQAEVPAKGDSPAKPSNEQLKIPAGDTISRLSSFKGAAVQTATGKPAGKIDDVLLDLFQGRVALFVVALDASGVEKGAHVLVPAAALERGKGDVVMLRSAPEHLSSAPHGDALSQPSLSRSDLAKVYAHFQQSLYKSDDKATDNDVVVLTSLAALREMPVQNGQGAPLGSLRDFAVLPDGRIAYAAMGSQDAPQRMYPVPLSAFVVPAPQAAAWILELPADILEKTPTFSSAQWPKTIDRGWSEYVAVRYGNSALAGVNREAHQDSPAPKK